MILKLKAKLNLKLRLKQKLVLKQLLLTTRQQLKKITVNTFELFYSIALNMNYPFLGALLYMYTLS